MKTSFNRRFAVALTLLALAVCANGVTPAHAATFMVTNLDNSGAGSLRDAIMAANAAPGADTITFSVSGTITLGSTLPTITDTAGLTIDGTGQTVTISGAYLYQVLFVEAYASLTLDNLTIANGYNISGGGIANNGGTLTITNCTFSGNSAISTGGGIYTLGGSLTITNSTFSDNTAISSGGGIFGLFGETMTITNSTFSGNSAGSLGGAISTVLFTANLLNTIVANSPSGGNCSAWIFNGGNNIDDGTTCGWGSTDGSMSNTDPSLGALVDNGGPTQTFALLPGSPAIDGVTFNAPNGAPATDQRGWIRPIDSDLDGTPLFDIGAYEKTIDLFLPLIMR